jgi:hypothetical protein
MDYRNVTWMGRKPEARRDDVAHKRFALCYLGREPNIVFLHKREASTLSRPFWLPYVTTRFVRSLSYSYRKSPQGGGALPSIVCLGVHTVLFPSSFA